MAQLSTTLERDPAHGSDALWPIWCTELHLGGGVPEMLVPPPGTDFRSARVLLRLHGDPLGFVHVACPPEGFTAWEAVAQADASIVRRAQLHLDQGCDPAYGNADGLLRLPFPGSCCPTRSAIGPSVTVAVCTRNRGELLINCLDHLKTLAYPLVDVIVVGNAPVDGSTKAAFDHAVGNDARFRYVVEPAPGLSRARNRALAEATGEIIAYTDDDVIVDPHWVDRLVAGFARDTAVGCVTGLVCTAEIRGAAEAYFDGRYSWGETMDAQRFSRTRNAADPLFPYSPGIFGTGANFAFRTAFLIGMGGFDPALGAGTPAGGGEDLDAFVRVIQAGAEIAYEPAALVWHHHRADLAGLDRQIYSYGSGLTAFLTKHLLDSATRADVLRRIPCGFARLRKVPDAGRKAAPSPVVNARALMIREMIGMVAGPLLYLRGRRIR